MLNKLVLDTAPCGRITPLLKASGLLLSTPHPYTSGRSCTWQGHEGASEAQVLDDQAALRGCLTGRAGPGLPTSEEGGHPLTSHRPQTLS